MSRPRIAVAFSAASSGVGGQLDAAGLAPAAGLDLRLHHDGGADPGGRGLRLLGGVGHLARQHGYAVRGEELLRLVLVQVHEFIPPRRGHHCTRRRHRRREVPPGGYRPAARRVASRPSHRRTPVVPRAGSPGRASSLRTVGVDMHAGRPGRGRRVPRRGVPPVPRRVGPGTVLAVASVGAGAGRRRLVARGVPAGVRGDTPPHYSRCRWPRCRGRGRAARPPGGCRAVPDTPWWSVAGSRRDRRRLHRVRRPALGRARGAAPRLGRVCAARPLDRRHRRR